MVTDKTKNIFFCFVRLFLLKKIIKVFVLLFSKSNKKENILTIWLLTCRGHDIIIMEEEYYGFK